MELKGKVRDCGGGGGERCEVFRDKLFMEGVKERGFSFSLIAFDSLTWGVKFEFEFNLEESRDLS